MTSSFDSARVPRTGTCTAGARVREKYPHSIKEELLRFSRITAIASV